ncbi:MAG: hypothetical protein MUP64_14490 [Anaerolineae bacterium]|nr:hypothetical protein [Anaerolineae bacterium]
MDPLESMVDESPRSRFEYVVALLIMAATLLGVTVAFLHTHASLQEDRAARAAEVYAIQTMGEIVQNGYVSDYQAGLVYDYASLYQLALARQFGQLTAAQQGESDLAAEYEHEAGRLEAMRDALLPFSILLSDPRYAPQGDSIVPNLQLWADDTMAPVLELLAQQNASVEERDAWGAKADRYVSIITLSAVALFLYGLSLVSKTRVRLVFVAVGIMLTGASALWTLITALA